MGRLDPEIPHWLVRDVGTELPAQGQNAGGIRDRPAQSSPTTILVPKLARACKTYHHVFRSSLSCDHLDAAGRWRDGSSDRSGVLVSGPSTTWKRIAAFSLDSALYTTQPLGHAVYFRDVDLTPWHGPIKKIPRTHRYLVTVQGRTTIASLLAARNASLLAGELNRSVNQQPTPESLTLVDEQYAALMAQLRNDTL